MRTDGNITLLPVTGEEQVQAMCRLAETIWQEHFTPIIGAKQVSYMLDRFQSPSAVSKQLAEGYEYYMLLADGSHMVGYTGIRKEEDTLFLSKLYLDKENRKKGYARNVMNCLTKLCLEQKLSKIWLTVNRENTGTINAYRKMGFVTVREQKTDIENGFFMDDYVMEYYTDEAKRQHYFMEVSKKQVAEMSEKAGRKLTFCVTTFGCQMNARDSEKLAGILEAVGYVETDSEEADFVVYNTCTVRDNANQRVYGRLGYLNSLKRKNPHMKIALCGCMMQEPSVIDKIKKSYRFVDLIFGTHNLFKFAELLAQSLQSEKMVIDIWESTEQIVEDLPVERKFSFKSGINIMFGCNNFCSYCIVPYVRGRERSRNPKDILREIENLAKDGVKEIMLLGQNVNSYGKNLDAPMSFAELLQEVEQIDGIERIRFMTSHPKDLSDDLIAVMKSSRKICRHLHLPLQSGSTRILKDMNRHYTKEQYLALVSKIRREIPDIAITTDIIVGFPGETLADVEETIEVVKEVQFDNAFTFIYSKRTGTPAAAMENQVSEEVIKEGFDKLLKTVQDTARERVKRLQGQVMTALVEEVNDQDSTLVTGRLSNNTLVHFPGNASLIGQIVTVKLQECKGFYYLGEMI